MRLNLKNYGILALLQGKACSGASLKSVACLELTILLVFRNAMDFIPNDTYLGGNHPNIIVLTGPNMGGKSTLLRQVGRTVGHHLQRARTLNVIFVDMCCDYHGPAGLLCTSTPLPVNTL